MKKILIVEDEKPASDRIASLIKSLRPHYEIIEVLDSIESTIHWLQHQQKPDLILLDIHLADGNSFHIFDQVKVEAPIIFTTAYDQYAIKAFKQNSVDYLLKPVDSEELLKAIEKFEKTYTLDQSNLTNFLETIKAINKSYKSRFLVRYLDKLISIPVEEILYFVSEEKMVFLYTNKTRFPVDFTLDHLEEVLDPNLFFRINRKCLASYISIHKISIHFNNKLKVELTPALPNEELLISKEKSAAFKNWLDR